MAPPEIAVLGGAVEGWHGRRLRAALEALDCRVHRVAFDRCRIEVGGSGGGIRLGELARAPEAVVVRSIPPGSFEQVTLRLGLLHALERQGVRVTNGARAIECCIDKSAASLLFARAGLPTPATWVAENHETAAAIAGAQTVLGETLVLKPLFGAQGKGLRLIRDPSDLPPPEEIAGVYYLQRFVGRQIGDASTWRDFRVFVVGGRAVAAMARAGPHWITNIGQGGTPQYVPASGRLAELAVAAAAAVATDHAGVDLIEDPSAGLQVLEVNSMPAWQALQSVNVADIARHIAADIARRLPGRT